MKHDTTLSAACRIGAEQARSALVCWALSIAAGAATFFWWAQ